MICWPVGSSGLNGPASHVLCPKISIPNTVYCTSRLLKAKTVPNIKGICSFYSLFGNVPKSRSLDANNVVMSANQVPDRPNIQRQKLHVICEPMIYRIGYCCTQYLMWTINIAKVSIIPLCINWVSLSIYFGLQSKLSLFFASYSKPIGDIFSARHSKTVNLPHLRIISFRPDLAIRFGSLLLSTCFFRKTSQVKSGTRHAGIWQMVFGEVESGFFGILRYGCFFNIFIVLYNGFMTDRLNTGNQLDIS